MPSLAKIDTFRQSFREEAREIAIELEAALLALHEQPEDTVIVGRVFRALHTIKGSGSMFGFERLAAFTHNLETMFDEVRNGRMEVSAHLVDLTLAALDHIRRMVEEDPERSADLPESQGQILEEMRRLCDAGETSCGGAGGETAVPSQPAAGGESGAQTGWQIRFVPGPEMMLRGQNPLLLLRELSLMGKLDVKAVASAIPPLAELEAERCYVSWEMRLDTSASIDAIRDVFIFVEDSCALTIDAPDAGCPVESKPETKHETDAPTLSPAELTARGLAEQRSAGGGRRFYDSPDNASSIRVPAAKLDQLVDLVGELVSVQARFSELAMRRDDPDVLAVSEEVERLTAALRENSMNIRMLPIRSTFERFRRLVHDLARDLKKNVELTIEGAETELDKTVIDQLSDPLMHLIRNSMDHGIEPEADRVSAGKPATATIHLSARQAGGSVLIGVEDDGGGIRVEAVRRRAVEKGLIAADAELAEAEMLGLIFQPGFSTAREITDVSGRGVGMDVVRQRVDALRGSIEVSSKPGTGTSVTLRLPLTMAIIDGLLVRVDEAYFVLPLANTLECIALTRADIEAAHGQAIANVRGDMIPYICLREHFHLTSQRPGREQIMVVETEDGRFGLVVDEVLGECQTVIKSLGRFYRRVQMVSGATILGNGTVALILDPHRLLQDALRTTTLSSRGHPGPRLAAGPQSVPSRPRIGRGMGIGPSVNGWPPGKRADTAADY